MLGTSGLNVNINRSEFRSPRMTGVGLGATSADMNLTGELSNNNESEKTSDAIEIEILNSSSKLTNTSKLTFSTSSTLSQSNRCDPSEMSLNSPRLSTTNTKSEENAILDSVININNSSIGAFTVRSHYTQAPPSVGEDILGIADEISVAFNTSTQAISVSGKSTPLSQNDSST
jgi:hypothetical protein